MRITAILLAIIASSCFADDIKAQDDAKAKAMLQKLGLPLPDSGINIVPRTMLNISQEQLAIGKAQQEEMDKNGYVLTQNSDAPLLFSFKKEASKAFASKSYLSSESTGIRQSVNDISLTFEVKSLNMQAKNNDAGWTVLGAVPYGSYNENGWTGVAEFFKTQDFEVCSYSVMDVKTSHTAAQIAMEDVIYAVNNKASLYSASGNAKQGFSYLVKWFDQSQFHELTCATKKHSTENKQKLFDLANKLDN